MYSRIQNLPLRLPFAIFVIAGLLTYAIDVAAFSPGASLNPYCPAMDGIVERVVTCLQDIIIETAYRFIDQIYPPIEVTIHIFLTLAIIFFGMRMILWMVEKPGRDIMVFVLKAACVAFFTANMDMVLDWLVGEPGDAVAGSLGELLEIVTAFTTFDFPLKCPSGFNVWQRIDCLLDVIIGVNPPITLTNGMLAFFFHNFFVGSVGVVIGLLGIWMIFSIVIGMLTAIHTYLMAIMMICLLVIVGVLFCPVIMFRNSFDVFQKWVRSIIASVIIPVVLFAYLNIMLSAFDIVLYSGEHSIFRTFAGDAVDADNFNIQEYMYSNNLVLETEDKGVILDDRQTQFPIPTGEVLKGEYYQFAEYPDSAKFANPANIAEIPLAIPMSKIDYDAAAARVGAGSGPDLMQQMLGAMIVTALVSYILITMLKYIPTLAADLAGGLREAPSIAQVSAQEIPIIGRGYGGGATSMTESFRQRMSGMLGRR